MPILCRRTKVPDIPETGIQGGVDCRIHHTDPNASEFRPVVPAHTLRDGTLVIEFVTGTKHNRLRHLHAEIQPVGRGYQVDWATGKLTRPGAGDIDPVPEIEIALGKIGSPIRVLSLGPSMMPKSE